MFFLILGYVLLLILAISTFMYVLELDFFEAIWAPLVASVASLVFFGLSHHNIGFNLNAGCWGVMATGHLLAAVGRILNKELDEAFWHLLGFLLLFCVAYFIWSLS